MPGGVIDEIKSKLDIVQIVSEHVPLKKAGASWRACCPFHGEKTPSFFVNPDRQRWHCFGCGADGDVFGFIEQIEGVDFSEALRMLAKRTGVVLHQEDAAASGERQRLIEANTQAARFWHEVLTKHPLGEKALAYALRRRALQPETIDDWVIGFAPDSWDATLNALKRKGFTEQELFNAGLVSRSTTGRGHFDRFRNRLMFPIRDANGNIVGFTGRVMPGPDGKDPADEGKYVNTNQTLIYNKSRILFGLDRAKQEIRKQGIAVIVEGNMDVVSVHQAGFRNVVASSGTALTAEQLNLLKHKADRLVLSFDNDSAGETAARRGIDAAVAQDFTVRVLRLPPEAGKDPDDCVRKSPDLWRKAVAEAVPYMQWSLDLARQRTDFSDPDSKKAAAGQLLGEIAKMREPVEQSHWIRELGRLFDTPESLLFEKLAKLKGMTSSAPVAAVRPAMPTAKSQDRRQVVSEGLLALIFKWPELTETAVNLLLPEYFDDEHRELYRNFVVSYNARRNGETETRRLPAAPVVDETTAPQVAILELRADKDFGDLAPELRREALVKLMGEIKKLHIDRRRKDLIYEMSQAEKAGDEAKIREIQRQIDGLIA